MSRLRVLVVDDEAVARRRLLRLLGEIADVEVVGECADGVEALARMSQGGVDVVLLDIQMPRLDGVEALRLLDGKGPAVIFTTAHAEHALQAFEHAAVDYLLKPFERERLEKALQRVRRPPAPPAPNAGATPVALPRLAIPTRKGVRLLPPEQIQCAVLDGESCLVCTDDEALVTDHRLSDLEERLPPELFVRVHRRALLNLAAVVRLVDNEVGGYDAELRNGRSVEVSRQAARRLRQQLGLTR